MAGSAFLGIDGKARKIKRLYFGADNKARPVKKAYIGIGGKARPFFSSGPIEYFGTTPEPTGLYDSFSSSAKLSIAASTVEGYALFAAMCTATGMVVAYNSALTKIVPSALAMQREAFAAASFGDVALFGGGGLVSQTPQFQRAQVEAYDSALSRSVVSGGLSQARSYLAAAGDQKYVLFAGGKVGSSGYSDVVDAFDPSRTRTTPTTLSATKAYLAGASTGRHFLFGGGANGGDKGTNAFATVDAYDSDTLTRTQPTGLSLARKELAAVRLQEYVIFGGGSGNVVDAYNASLTRTVLQPLMSQRTNPAAVKLGNYAMFVSGAITVQTGSRDADAYDTSLTRVMSMTLPFGSRTIAGATVGKYAIFTAGMLAYVCQANE